MRSRVSTRASCIVQRLAPAAHAHGANATRREHGGVRVCMAASECAPVTAASQAPRCAHTLTAPRHTCRRFPRGTPAACMTRNLLGLPSAPLSSAPPAGFTISSWICTIAGQRVRARVRMRVRLRLRVHVRVRVRVLVRVRVRVRMRARVQKQVEAQLQYGAMQTLSEPGIQARRCSCLRSRLHAQSCVCARTHTSTQDLAPLVEDVHGLTRFKVGVRVRECRPHDRLGHRRRDKVPPAVERLAAVL